VAIASEFSRNFRRIMLLSVLCGIFICLAGLAASYLIEFPSGASIILIGGILLGLVKGIKKLAGLRTSRSRGIPPAPPGTVL